MNIYFVENLIWFILSRLAVFQHLAQFFKMLWQIKSAIKNANARIVVNINWSVDRILY